MRSTKFLYAITGLFLLASVGVLVFLVARGVNRPQNATPSRAYNSDPGVCQGNPNAVAKCFDCYRDATASGVVNILDFACFTKFYGQTVGK